MGEEHVQKGSVDVQNTRSASGIWDIHYMCRQQARADGEEEPGACILDRACMTCPGRGCSPVRTPSRGLHFVRAMRLFDWTDGGCRCPRSVCFGTAATGVKPRGGGLKEEGVAYVAATL